MASEGQETKMPKKDTYYIEFEKHNTKLPCPFVIHGDFECLTTISNTEIKGTFGTEGALSCSGNSAPRGTYQEHEPCGYMLTVVSRIDNTCKPYYKKNVEQLTEIKKYIFEKMNVNKPMDELTNEQKLEFNYRLIAPSAVRNLNLMVRKSVTTASSPANTEAQRM